MKYTASYAHIYWLAGAKYLPRTQTPQRIGTDFARLACLASVVESVEREREREKGGARFGCLEKFGNEGSCTQRGDTSPRPGAGHGR